ncbi:MAG: XdhC family protein [Rhodospirillaceae bacterium]|nr:XdhC family protein [Rhodospirillaceae bacterium]
MRREILDRLNGDRAAERGVALVTALDGGAQSLVYAEGDSVGELLPDAVAEAARDALRTDRSRQVEEGDATWFVHVHNPPARMVIVGAVHITQALAGMAEAAGYDVIVCDPRRAFADDARFPAVEVSTEWPDDALSRLVPDHRTAVVTLTHDPKIDDPALEVAVRAPVFYIGALGSRRTHGKRLERLRAKGFSDDELGRIHAPIGLAIGARSPAEIAVSIMAEVTQVRRQPPGGNS